MRNFFNEYLEYVGYLNDIDISFDNCEICSSNNFSKLINNVKIDKNKFFDLPVMLCNRCGFIMQNPKFEKRFYDWYFHNHYSQLLFGNKEPEKNFILDQVRRGAAIYKYLNKYLPEKGNLLDVGCSSGGLMVAFAQNGWEVLGTDPDKFYAGYGKKHLGIEIQTVSAEDMQLREKYFDLIIIASALEHVYDINKVIENCRYATVRNGLIFIETRGLDHGVMNGYFSHNYRRYLTSNTLHLLLKKYGYEILWSTKEAVAGSSRPGSTFTLARAQKLPLQLEDFFYLIDNSNKDSFDDIKQKIKGVIGAT